MIIVANSTLSAGVGSVALSVIGVVYLFIGLFSKEIK